MGDQTKAEDGQVGAEALAEPTGSAVAPVEESLQEVDAGGEAGADAEAAREVQPEANDSEVAEAQGAAAPPVVPGGDPSEEPLPWAAVTEMRNGSPKRTKVRREATAAVLLMVDETRSAIPTWQRALGDVLTALAAEDPAQGQTEELLDVTESGGPASAAAAFRARDQASRQDPAPAVQSLSAHSLLGSHAKNLVLALADAGRWWNAAVEAADSANYDSAKFHVERAQAALGRAMQHALYLTLLGDARATSIGTRTDIAGYCEGWGLSDPQVAALALWVKSDGLKFGTESLPLALDTAAQGVYRRASAVWIRICTAAAPIWGGALVFGVVALFFAILHTAGITTWPKEWVAKLLAVVICVALGALAHIAARGLNINYDNPITVYNAGGVWNWLALRWLGVLYMFIPVGVVVALLWGSKTIPGSFKDLGAAVLAGYSADSLVRAGVAKLQQQSAAGQTPSTATGAATTAQSTPSGVTTAQ